MKASQNDLSKCCIHTITTKPWPLEKALDAYQDRGIGGVSIWQNAIEKMGTKEARKALESSDLEVVSYVRGGFFAHSNESERQKSIDHNKQMIEEAAEIGAPLLVLVCGAHPGQSLTKSRDQIKAGIETLIPFAEKLNVKLGIEPLHPMYADTRSAISTLSQANKIAESLQSSFVGVVVDVYHLWWDDRLEEEILRCGKANNLLAYHICDWKVPTNHMLTDRGIMGEGCIPLKSIGSWIDAAGFEGFKEVEIFSNEYWAMDQEIYLNKIVEAYQQFI